MINKQKIFGLLNLLVHLRMDKVDLVGMVEMVKMVDNMDLVDCEHFGQHRNGK